jgi:hypothetical protein
VTGIAGTFVDLPYIPFTYYNPDDGLVGEASALNRRDCSTSSTWAGR